MNLFLFIYYHFTVELELLPINSVAMDQIYYMDNTYFLESIVTHLEKILKQ